MVYLPAELHAWVRDVSAAGRRMRPRGPHPLPQTAVIREALLRLQAEQRSPAKAADALLPPAP